MAYIKSRKHAAPRQSTFTHTAAIGLMAVALPVAAQNAEPPKKPDAAPEVTLPAVRAKAKTTTVAPPEVDFKADTVSSPKFTQPLVDTPQTITVIKKEVLQQQAATSLSEALRSTPGITLQLGENGNTQTGDSIFMRGFDTSGSIFVDGVRDIGTISRDIFNVEQIEITKGASGSDYGRTTASGNVNLASKAPTNEAFAAGSLTVGTHDRARATVDLNQPLNIGIPGTALRLNLMKQEYGTPGRDEVKNDRWGIAPSLAFGLGTPTRLTLSYLHVEQTNVPDGGVSAFGMPGYGFGTLTPGSAVDRSNYYGLSNDHDNVKADMVTTLIEHDFTADTRLRNVTRVGRTTQDYLLTGINAVNQSTLGADPNNPATWLVARSRQGKGQINEILTNQTNINTSFKTGSVKHDLSTGLEFTYERQSNEAYITSGTQVPANLYNPNPNDPAVSMVPSGAYTKGNTLTGSLYAFDTLTLTEQWLVTGGLRWDRYRTEFLSIPAATVTPQTATNIAGADDLFTGKVSLMFKPNKDASVYVTYASSAQPPGGATFSLNATAGNANNPAAQPQKGSNIEVGTKWDLYDGKLSLTGAVYRTENRNEVVTDATNPLNNGQIGKRRVQGVELGAVGSITPAFNLIAALAYMDPKIIQGSTTATNTTNGGVIVFSPKVTFTSWATYKLPIGLTVGGGLRYVDTTSRSSNVTPSATGLNEVPSYWVADAMLSYDINKNVSLQLNVANLFDKEYLTSLNSGGSRYRPGEERNALLTASFRY